MLISDLVEQTVKRWIAVIALMMSAQAFADTAKFTGRRESGWTVTRLQIIMCEYQTEDGRRIWQTVRTGGCPKTVEVQVAVPPKAVATN